VKQYNDTGDSLGQIVTKISTTAAGILPFSSPVHWRAIFISFLEQTLMGFGAILAQVSL